MSNIALSWAFKCHVGNASAKAVLVYLADRADDDGTAAYPKIATIVNVTELSERTVRTALKTLQERGFIRRGDQRYARLGKGGRNRLPQYCQIVWDLAVESDPSTLEWIKETHTAEHDPKTMGNTVDPAASTIMENGESKDVLPENVGTKPIPSTANLAGLEKGPEPALQIPQGQHCESCTPSTANAAPPALQISQSCIYKDKTLQVNPPSKPSFPSAPTGHLPASGAAAAEKNKNEQLDEDDTEIAEAAGRVLASLGEQRSMLGLATPLPTKADRKAIIGLYRRLVDQGAQWPTLVMVDAIGFAMNGDWWPKRIRTGRAGCRDAVLTYIRLEGLNERNDRFGLQAGDESVIAAAQCVADFCRACEDEGESVLCFRTGGNEFALIRPEPHTDSGQLHRQFRAVVARYNRTCAPRARITMTFGFSRLCDEDGKSRSISAWKAEADAYLKRNATRLGGDTE